MSTSQDIELCHKCEGKGYTTYDECVDYHKREYETHFVKCHFCDGYGRVLKMTTIKYLPYKTGWKEGKDQE